MSIKGGLISARTVERFLSHLKLPVLVVKALALVLPIRALTIAHALGAASCLAQCHWMAGYERLIVVVVGGFLVAPRFRPYLPGVIRSAF